MATNEKNFRIKKGLTVGDGIIVEGGAVDFTNASEILGINADSIIETVKNVSAGTLTKGTVVYQSGSTGTVAEVEAADNTSASTMPAIGVLNEDLTAGSEGEAVFMGKIASMDTSSFSAGDTLYVGTSGALTATAPTGESTLVQNIGKVIKSHAVSGSLLITGAGRSNATPNLNDGNIFIGNASNQSSTSSFNDLVDAHVNVSTATTGQILKWTGSDYDWDDAGASEKAVTEYNVGTSAGSYTGSTTDFPVNYTVGQVYVFVNGNRLQASDFTATSGTNIVLAVAASANDAIAIEAFTPSNIVIDSPTYTSVDVTTITLGNWTFAQDGSGHLTISTGGNVKAKLETDGDFLVAGDMTAFATL